LAFVRSLPDSNLESGEKVADAVGLLDPSPLPIPFVVG
jgi:hypothetical protein